MSFFPGWRDNISVSFKLCSSLNSEHHHWMISRLWNYKVLKSFLVVSIVHTLYTCHTKMFLWFKYVCPDDFPDECTHLPCLGNQITEMCLLRVHDQEVLSVLIIWVPRKKSRRDCNCWYFGLSAYFRFYRSSSSHNVLNIKNRTYNNVCSVELQNSNNSSEQCYQIDLLELNMN